ncbi:B-lymphocyte antigen CD19 isoform X2 [Struthio camelus]|uniref:B-lymphocyte antigen CD19 isoform X2 n=1 Tax=Struthio camelus TaxID=8801 RepID=UPI0036042456
MAPGRLGLILLVLLGLGSEIGAPPGTPAAPLQANATETLFVSAAPGSDVTLRCPGPPANASALPPASWFHEGQPLPSGGPLHPGGLLLRAVGQGQAGRYDCAVGPHTGTVHLHLGGDAAVVWAAVGATAVLPCGTEGLGAGAAGGLAWAWHAGMAEKPVLQLRVAPGAWLWPSSSHGAALALLDVRPGQAGRYRCAWGPATHPEPPGSTRRLDVQLDVQPAPGWWPRLGAGVGTVGAAAVAYVVLGGAVLAGLCHSHRALQSRKCQRRLGKPARRVPAPDPQSPYGNVLCPTAAPRPPADLGSPTALPPGGPWGGEWGRTPPGRQQEEEEEEEEEEEGGYEHPDSDGDSPGDGYENGTGPRGDQASVGSYENGLEAAAERWGAAAPHYANTCPAPGTSLRDGRLAAPAMEQTPLSPGAARLVSGLQRVLLSAGERQDGRSEGSAGSQPYEDMAGGGLYAAPRRGPPPAPDDDADSYENMEGTRSETAAAALA